MSSCDGLFRQEGAPPDGVRSQRDGDEQHAGASAPALSFGHMEPTTFAAIRVALLHHARGPSRFYAVKVATTWLRTGAKGWPEPPARRDHVCSFRGPSMAAPPDPTRFSAARIRYVGNFPAGVPSISMPSTVQVSTPRVQLWPT